MGRFLDVHLSRAPVLRPDSTSFFLRDMDPRVRPPPTIEDSGLGVEVPCNHAAIALIASWA